MIKLASITPVLDDQLSLGDSHVMMFLTHLVLEFPDYAAHAKAYRGYKILDNSLIELGGALDIEKVLTAAALIDADEIVLPDEFKKGPETIIAVTNALNTLDQYYKQRPGSKRYKLMAVAQGSDMKEFITCFELLAKNDRIDVIGIPKAQKARLFLSHLYDSTDKEIHFLGCPESLDEIRQMNLWMLKRIRSIDTCIPALNSNLTDDPWASRPTDYTINLKTDRVNTDNYHKIIAGVNEYIDYRAAQASANENVYIYLAGPLFTEGEQRERRQEAAALRAEGYRVFNPLELNESGVSDPNIFFKTDLAAMTQATLAIVRADNVDSGTMVELGWFAGAGKPIITIWSDFRSAKPNNAFVAGIAEHRDNLLLRTFDIRAINEYVARFIKNGR